MLHAGQAAAVLDSGRHVASAMPIGPTLAEIDSVIAAADRSTKNHMMMETAVCQREYLFVRDLYDRGALGEVTFLHGAHIRDRTQMPKYWRGFPPMTYATRAVSPLLALLRTRAATLHAFASGSLADDQNGHYGNPYRLETATFQPADTPAVMQITQGCFSVARTAVEGFNVYGSRMSVEWPTVHEADGLTVYTMDDQADQPQDRFRRVNRETVHPPDQLSARPPALARFTRPTTYRPGDTGPTLRLPSRHGGSHPHLVHEFVSSIIEHRPAAIDARTAGEWCAPGGCSRRGRLATGRTPTPDSVFDLASVSKQITAVAVLLLAGSGNWH